MISKKWHAPSNFKPPFDTVTDDNFYMTPAISRVWCPLKIKTLKKNSDAQFFAMSHSVNFGLGAPDPQTGTLSPDSIGGFCRAQRGPTLGKSDVPKF